jgi:hypothetical protein
MDRKTQGAWIIHHGKKISGTNNGAANYPTIDIAAKSGALLARMAGSNQSELNSDLVITLAKAGGLSPKTDLPACLSQLASQKVIDRAANGSVSIIGVTASSALDHTSSLFETNDPEPFEIAAIGLGELVSQSPVGKKLAGEKIGDEYRLTTADVNDFLGQATALGFIESDEDGDDPLLFNGNLFRRDSIAKTKKVLDSLDVKEQAVFLQFEAALKSGGALKISEAERMLGTQLISKLRAAAVFDENITSPGAFHKFSNPMIDDAFDHAKALVAALSYGMHVSSTERGQIWGVDLLLKKMLRGEPVGPAPAIGQDYRALELERVISITAVGSRYSMQLLKREVGEIALQVLQHGSAAAAAIGGIPGAQVTGYTGPEKARANFRKRKDIQPSKSQMRGLLSAVRSGGGL